jgi:hypothetical protein
MTWSFLLSPCHRALTPTKQSKAGNKPINTWRRTTRKRLNNIPFFRHATYRLPQPRGLLDPTPDTKPIPRHTLHRRHSMLRLSFEPTLRLYVLLILLVILGKGIALVRISLFHMTVYTNIGSQSTILVFQIKHFPFLLRPSLSPHPSSRLWIEFD